MSAPGFASVILPTKSLHGDKPMIGRIDGEVGVREATPCAIFRYAVICPRFQLYWDPDLGMFHGAKGDDFKLNQETHIAGRLQVEGMSDWARSEIRVLMSLWLP